LAKRRRCFQPNAHSGRYFDTHLKKNLPFLLIFPGVPKWVPKLAMLHNVVDLRRLDKSSGVLPHRPRLEMRLAAGDLGGLVVA
jgi:hypothetical protein